MTSLFSGGIFNKYILYMYVKCIQMTTIEINVLYFNWAPSVGAAFNLLLFDETKAKSRSL